MKFPKHIPPAPEEEAAVTRLRIAVAGLSSTLRLQIDQFETDSLSVHKQDHPMVYTKIANIPCRIL